MPYPNDDFDPLTGLPRQRPQAPGVPAYYTTTADAPFGATIGSPSSASQGPSSGYSTSAPTARMVSYADLIANDPGFRQLKADLSAQGISDAAGLRAARQRGVIQFGEAPDYQGVDQGFLGGGYSADIDEGTRALASQNTAAGLSTSARLAKAQSDNIRAIKNVLAARGGLRSGELGHQLREQNLGYAQSQYDARQRLLDYMSSISSAYARAEYERQRALAAGASQAAGNYQASGAPPPVQGAPPVAPDFVAPPTSQGASDWEANPDWGVYGVGGRRW